MYRTLIALRIAILAALLAFFVVTGAAPPNSSRRASEQSRPESPAERRSADAIAQGKYLVHHVAMCVKCHTPKDETGKLNEMTLLAGAPIPVENPYPNRRWAVKAPKIAGLPGGWTERELSHFLQTGETPTGYSVSRPMPPFRMKEPDADAVAAYLKSLRGAD